MKDILKELNNEKIDFDQFEKQSLTDIEKKVIKKRIKKKLNGRRSMPVKIISLVASIALVSIIAVNSNFALANISIIGEKLEAFVYSKAGTLTDYKTIVGESVEDNGVKVTLNEIILDEGQLLISSTFHTNFKGDDLAYNWFTDIDVYIDGQKIEMGGGGGPREITESYINYFWAADIGDIDLKNEKAIRIVFNDLERSDSEKIMKGKWKFKFKASGENLIASTNRIPINHSFTLENGQNIVVEELILTPITSKLVYKMTNISEDLFFKIEDEYGEEIQEIGGRYSGLENYNRFAAIEGGKIKIIPISYKEHKQEYIHADEIFELDLDEMIKELEGK
ncbi:DUF4179 domain-containing protein [Solibacillus sp. CAU 1738]|uniref:DUF4179 domain-containing protein n=1 Tax=Solibacillus sp. CAU 1738 TaxID=3140363 RepID=UPI0032600EA8